VVYLGFTLRSNSATVLAFSSALLASSSNFAEEDFSIIASL
jgi:hypothetical protein